MSSLNPVFVLPGALKERGVAVESFNASLLCEPDKIATRSGRPFSVFTPFWKALQVAVAPAPPPSALSPLPINIT